MSLPPAASILSMALKPSVMLRLNRSRFQHTSAAASPRSIRSMHLSHPGRDLPCPALVSSSSITSMSVSPSRSQMRSMEERWRSGLMNESPDLEPTRDTLTYPIALPAFALETIVVPPCVDYRR
jgi:hypothetical protein